MRKLILVLALLTLSSQLPAAADRLQKSVPLELLPSGHIALKVKFNGQGPFRMILDTGAPLCLLGNRAALKIGLVKPQPKSATPDSPIAAMMKSMRGAAKLKSVQVGDVHTEDLSIMVLDHPTIDALATVVGPLDGILGLPFFSRFRMTLDYSKGTASFEPVEYQTQDVMTGLMFAVLGGKQARIVIAPGAQWGMNVDKTDKSNGVIVTQVYSGSAADKGGLRIGDRIMTLDGRWTDTIEDCYQAASLVKAGQLSSIKVMRNNLSLELNITPRLGL